MMLTECTKLLTGAPQARRSAAVCTSGCKHPSHSFNAYMKSEVQARRRHDYTPQTEVGTGSEFSRKLLIGDSTSQGGSGSGCERSVSYLYTIVDMYNMR